MIEFAISVLLGQDPSRTPPPQPQPSTGASAPASGSNAAAPKGTQASPQTPAPTPADPPLVLRHVFLKAHDANRDGRLDPSELPRKYAKFFAKADLDGDGFLDANEILYDRHAIGRVARQWDELELTRDGRLVQRGQGRGNKPPIGAIAGAILGEVDSRLNGVISQHPIGAIAMEQLNPGGRPNPPVQQPGDSGMQPVPQAPPDGAAPTPNPVPDASSDSAPKRAAPAPQARPAAPQKSVSPPAPAAKGKGGAEPLPTADEIIKGLDRNGDGMLDRTEAVDQLLANFDRLDRNRDGKLSKEEVEHGLRLARLFGIKPMKPPASYAPPASGSAPPQTPNPAPNAPASGS